MIQIEKDSPYSLCAQSQGNDIVCPSYLCKGLFIVSAMDNVDHDPSSKTAQSSFHGTGTFNLTQFPGADDMGAAIEPVATVATDRLDLPHSYTIVPAVALSQSKTEVVQRTYVETFCCNFEKASHHAHLQPLMTDPRSVQCCLF